MIAQRFYWIASVFVVAQSVVLAQSAPTSYQSEFLDIGSRTIDVSKPVGVIEGKASVSATGAANYTIPVPLPPGTNGIAPHLAIVYNSRGADGLLGTGWSLSGTSSIVRSGKNFFHDQASTPIQFSANDRFLLDGQRLVLTSGSNYGQTGTVYDTENATFATITAVGTYGSGPASFTMVTKEGITMEYGTNASTIRTSDDQEVLAWRLSRVRDAYGNTMCYNYGDLDGEPMLLSITYAQNAAQGLNAYCTVDFTYSYRSDPNMASVPRRVLYQRHLLDRITATVTAPENGGATDHVFRSMEFKYCLRDLGRSYLNEVVEHGRDNTSSLNTTVIQYGDETEDAVEGTGITIPVEELSDVYTGDYDGDGRSDVLRAYYTIDAGEKRVTQLRVYPANGDPAYTHVLSSSAFYANLPNTGDNHQSFLSTDFNGDGKDDICIVHTQYAPGGGSVFDFLLNKVQLLLSTPTDSVDYTTVEYDPPDAAFPGIMDPSNSILYGDFDGDGKTELIVHCVVPSLYTVYKLSMLKDGAWIELPVPAGTDNNLKNPDRMMVVDVNGDRKHDLLVLNQPTYNWNYPNSCSVYSWNGIAMENISTSAIPSATMKSDPGDDLIYAVYPGDFNGDGNTDLLVNADLSSIDKWRIYFSNGTGYSSTYAPFTFAPLPAWPSDRFRIVVADINGDGRSDVFHFHSPSGTNNLSIYYSVGHTGWAPIFNAEHMHLATPLGTLYPCDQNGDGRVDIVSFTGWNAPLRTLLINHDGRERLLLKIANGINATTEFHYASAPQALLNSTTDRSYPIIRTNFPIDLVDTLTVPDGIGGTTREVRRYYDAFVHVGGRGLMGFMITSCENVETGNAWNTWNSFDESYAMALPDHSAISVEGLGPLSVTASAVNWSPVVTTVSPGRFSIRMPNEVAYNGIANTSKTTDRIYDPSGNVVEQSVAIGFGYPVTNVDVETTITAFEAFGPSPVPAKPTQITVQRTRTGAPQITSVTKQEYNAQGAMFRKTEFYGTPMWVKTEFTFNALGLVDGKVLSSANSGTNGGQSETYLYDPTGRFVATKQFMYFDGAANWITQSTDYDLHRGLPKKVIGADGLKVDYTYDAFDRVETESAPYFTTPSYVVTHALDWDISAPERYYRTWVQDPARPDVKTWYDLLGRATRTETEAFGAGNWSIQETQYDALGRVSREVAPHFASETVMDVQYTYDALDRTIAVQSSVAGTSNIVYAYNNGLSTVTTTSPSGQETSETTDASGLAVSTKDDGGVLNHTYDSWGNLLTTKRGATTIISNSYDAYGRQTQLTDASAGTTQYQHDAFGRLIYQQDANNNSVNFTYDNLGRLRTRGGTAYQYYYQNGRFSSLPMQVSEGTATVVYTYDNLLRTSTETRTIDGETFATGYTYDLYDNVSTIQYPGGVLITCSYAQNCFVDQVKRGTVVLFDLVAMNGQGQETQYMLGDGKKVVVSYTNGLPTRYYAAGVQDLRMDYNYTTGNLNHRWDKLINRKESFTYDALDRLTTSTVATVDASGNPLSTSPPVTIQYDGTVGSTTRGQIKWKTDVGKFNNVTSSNAVNLAFGPTPGTTAPAGISQATQTITYDNYLRTASISEAVGSDAYVLNYTYGPDRQRSKSVLKKNGSVVETRIYCGAYEEQRLAGTTNKVHYISGPAGLCAMIVVANGVETIYYTYTDHLGSVTALTRKVGTVVTVVAKRSFDPWGKERNATTWNGPPATTPAWLYRGFTGHEHVQPFGLINMNARMYDPVNGRMLAPDNYLQAGLGTQGYNRYSYAGNNPLRYTDPTGNWLGVDDLVAGLIGGVVNLGVNIFNGNLAGMDFWDAVGTGAAAFGAGAAAGTLSLYGPVGWAAGGAILGATNAWVAGGDGNQILTSGLSGVFSGLAGGAAGQWAASGISGVMINSWNVTSPVVKGLVAGAAGGAAGGYAGGYVGNYLLTGDATAANEAALSGMLSGAAFGAGIGAGAAYLQATKNNINPWNGRPNKSVVIGEGMEKRVKPAAGLLKSETIAKPFTDAGLGTGYLEQNMIDPRALEFNAHWIEIKMEAQYYIYDVGPRGSTVSSPFYNLEIGRTWGYERLYNVRQVTFRLDMRIFIIYK